MPDFERSEFDPHEGPLQPEVFLGEPKPPNVNDLLRALGSATKLIIDKDNQLEAAEHDKLTGLLMAEPFKREAERLHDRMRFSAEHATEDLEVTLLGITDSNKFKEVNDSLGHLAGNALLRATAQSMRTHTRPGDVLGRFGGDEFTFAMNADRMLTEDELDRFGSSFKHKVDTDIRTFMTDVFEIDDPDQSVSVGVVTWGLAETFEEAFERADEKMRSNKRQHDGGR